MYFASYEWLVQREMETKAITRKHIGMGTAALYGAVAGYAMWLTCVPLLIRLAFHETDLRDAQQLPTGRDQEQDGATGFYSTFRLSSSFALFTANGWTPLPRSAAQVRDPVRLCEAALPRKRTQRFHARSYTHSDTLAICERFHICCIRADNAPLNVNAHVIRPR